MIADAAGTVGCGEQSSLSGMERYFIDNVRGFIGRTDDFILRQYRETITGTPSPEQLEEHRRELKWALWLCRLLYRGTSSEQFPERSLSDMLGGRLRQLEESWKLLFEPSSKEEAEKLDQMIDQHFPDEPRA